MHAVIQLTVTYKHAVTYIHAELNQKQIIGPKPC
jgi:hypothetical protein